MSVLKLLCTLWLFSGKKVSGEFEEIQSTSNTMISNDIVSDKLVNGKGSFGVVRMTFSLISCNTFCRITSRKPR